MLSLIRGTIALFLLMGAACSGEPSDIIERARGEARKVAPDAELVQIEFTQFGFAMGRGGIPDMTKAGPPRLALLNFYSRSSGAGFRVVADINRDPPPPEVAKMMAKQGYRDLRVERGPVPFSPFTLPVPRSIGEMNRAIAAAQQAIATDCAGARSAASSCALVQSAELHMHWAGPRDGGGTPVWTIRFGQHPRSLEPVRRAIESGSYRIYAGRDAQVSSFSDAPVPLRTVAIETPREFDAVWRAAVDAVRKQDPLYAPYAVSLITYLRDRHGSARVVLSEVHIQLARQTPSLIWEDIEAHIGWLGGSDSSAVLFFSKPRRRSAPSEPPPITMRPADLLRADGALAVLIAKFPDGYAEVSTTWAKGCEDLLTASPGLTMWRCGVYLPTEQRSDLVFLWLSRQNNPYWQSGRAPLASEYRMITDAAPRNGWSWWTRVKHPSYWEYFLIDATSGRPDPGFCTTPNTGSNVVRLRACGE